MARRLLTLAVRIALFALLLLGPMLVVLAVAFLVPAMPERLAKTLVMVAAIWFFSAILLAPVVIFRDSGSSGSDEDGGGDGGSRPPRAPQPPAPPRGGIPLPDAEPAKLRLRDHDRPAWRRLRPRRPAREPERAPATAPGR